MKCFVEIFCFAYRGRKYSAKTYAHTISCKNIYIDSIAGSIETMNSRRNNTDASPRVSMYFAETDPSYLRYWDPIK